MNISLFLSCYPVGSDPGFYPAQKLSPRSLHVKGRELSASEQQHLCVGYVPCRGPGLTGTGMVCSGGRGAAGVRQGCWDDLGPDFLGSRPCSQCGNTLSSLERSISSSSSSLFPRMRRWCRTGLSARERRILLCQCPPSFCPTFHSLFLYKLGGRN